MIETGRVVAIDPTPLGSSLVETAPIGATVLRVHDTVDFSEDGGYLEYNGQEVIEYETIDDDEDLIYLASPTTVASDEEDATVYVWDLDTETVPHDYLAFVNTGNEDFDEDAMEALIPHHLVAYLVEGIRAGESEFVTLEWVGDDLYIRDVHRTPRMSGDVLEPGTVPSTDGFAPETSPTPTLRPGIKTLFVFWEEVANADPVTYDVHVSTEEGFTASAANIVGSSPGTGPLVIRGLSDGSPLDAETTYYVRIVAHDADGYAPQGDEASATPALVTTDDVTADFIIANEVYANDAYLGRLGAEQIDTGDLNADVAVLGSLEVGEGIRIDPNNGIMVQTPTGVTHLPPDGSRARIAGDLTAESMEVKGNLEIRGTNNEVSKNAGLTLETGVTPPKAPPILSSYYPTTSIHEGLNPRGFAYHASRNRYVFTESLLSASITTVRRTAENNFVWEGNYGLNATWPEITGALGGIEMIGNTAYVLCQTSQAIPGTYKGRWYVYRVEWDTTAQEWQPLGRWLYEPNSNLGGNSPFSPAIGTDGTNIYITQSGAGGEHWLAAYSPTGTFLSQRRFYNNDGSRLKTSRRASGLIHVPAGTPGFAGERFVLVIRDWKYALVYDPSDGMREVVEEHFPLPETAGIIYQGGDWWTRSESEVYRHSHIYEDTTVEVVSTWRRHSQTNPPSYASAETEPGPSATITLPSRSHLRIQSGTAIPDDTADPDDADSVSFYLSIDGSEYRRVVAPAQQATVTRDTLPTSGDGPPSTTYGYSFGTPALIRSAAEDADGPIIVLRGSGAGRVGPFEWDEFGSPTGNYDTGWVALSLKSGYEEQGSTFTPMIRRIGKVVYLTGMVTTTSGSFASGSGYHDIADIPSGFDFEPGKPNFASLYFAANGQVTYSACRIRIIETLIQVNPGSTNQGYISLDGAVWTVD